jgi:hypothetical protein
MVRYSTRKELESTAKRLGYEPDRDDTDADLVLAINLRSPGMLEGLAPRNDSSSPGEFGLPATGGKR